MKAKYIKASTTGDFLTLENEKIKLVLWRRLCGWGFGELYSADGTLMAVLDHFGELLLRDQEIPMRLEADEYTYFEENGVRGYTFNVSTTLASEKLIGTSFDCWVHFPFSEPILKGTVTFSLKDGDDRIGLNTQLESTSNVYAKYLRLIWLLCGENSYGTRKTDALLPGVDWPVGDEWSSGTDFFKDPWADRHVPHPNKVGAPVMSVSCDGKAVAISYNLDKPVTRWFNYCENYPQPVFASPNFVERRNNSLIGIMLPDVKSEQQENKVFADEPLELHIGQRISFDAELYITDGTSLDALVSYVKRYGLPPVSPKYTVKEALEKIATAYNTNLWHEGMGFGYIQHREDRIGHMVPRFLRRYVAEHNGESLAEELKAKIDFCDSFPRHEPETAETKRRTQTERGEKLLGYQHDDGSFRFEPDGRHYTKDDFKVARSFIEPMGLDGDTALYMNIEPALSLMTIYGQTGDERFAKAAQKALDYCSDMFRPEGGDYWETPLHAPNLLAAGSAANTYYHAYRLFGKIEYKEKAVWYLRSLLAFTHIRQPKGIPSLYNTKPCLCSSDWYFANWVRDFVQWEVLQSVAQAASLNIDWTEIDPEIDWNRYTLGVTTATYNWLADSKTNTWRPHNIPPTYEFYLEGDYNCCFADTFNSVTGNIGGMVIPPSVIAENLYYLLDKGYLD